MKKTRTQIRQPAASRQGHPQHPIKQPLSRSIIALGQPREGSDYHDYQARLARPNGNGVIHIPDDPSAIRKWAQGDRQAFGHWLGLVQAGKMGGRGES